MISGQRGKKKNPQALSLISHSRKQSPLDVPALLERLLAAWRQHTSRPLTSWKMHWTINHATSQNFYYWSGQVKTSNDSCHQIIFVSAHAPLQVKKTLKKKKRQFSELNINSRSKNSSTSAGTFANPGRAKWIKLWAWSIFSRTVRKSQMRHCPLGKQSHSAASHRLFSHSL